MIFRRLLFNTPTPDTHEVDQLVNEFEPLEMQMPASSQALIDNLENDAHLFANPELWFYSYSFDPLQIAELLDLYAKAGKHDVVKRLYENAKQHVKYQRSDAVNKLHLAWQICVLTAWNTHRPLFDSALQSMLKNNDIQALEFIISHLTDFKLSTYLLEGKPIVIHAIESGHLPLVKWAVDKHGCALVEIDEHSPSPVLTAAISGNLPMMKWLVDVKRCSLLTINVGRNNALHFAAYNGHLALAKWLSDEKGMSLDSINASGRNPFILAVTNDHINNAWLGWLLIQRHKGLQPGENNSVSPVLVAAQSGSLQSLKAMLSFKGRSILNIKTSTNSYNPFILAVLNNQIAIMDYLYTEYEWSLLTKDNNNYNALLLAAEHGCTSSMDWLIAHGCSLNRTYNDGLNCVLLAAANGHIETLKWLVNTKAQVVATAQSKNGQNAVYFAAVNGHTEIVSWLVNENNCKVDAKHLLKKLHKITPEIFTLLLPHLIGKHEDRLDFIRKGSELVTTAEDKKTIATYYNNLLEHISANFIDENAKTDFDNILAYYYCAYPRAALEFHVRFLSQNLQSQEAAAICLSKLQDTDKECRKQACIELASLLMMEDFLHEEGSPLEIEQNNDEQEKEKEKEKSRETETILSLKSAIQIFYLIKDYWNDPSVATIKKILHKTLSNKAFGCTELDITGKTWTKPAFKLYKKYVFYKEHVNRNESELIDRNNQHLIFGKALDNGLTLFSSTSPSGAMSVREPKLSAIAKDLLASENYTFDIQSASDTSLTIVLQGELKLKLKNTVLAELGGHLFNAMRKQEPAFNYMLSNNLLTIHLSTKENKDVLSALLLQHQSHMHTHFHKPSGMRSV